MADLLRYRVLESPGLIILRAEEEVEFLEIGVV